MTEVRIYSSAKSAMQSGRAGLSKWRLEYEPDEKKIADPLMGWTGSRGTNGQVRLSFDTRDEAVAFAERNALVYRVEEPQSRRVQPKNYSAIFAFDAIE